MESTEGADDMTGELGRELWRCLSRRCLAFLSLLEEGWEGVSRGRWGRAGVAYERDSDAEAATEDSFCSSEKTCAAGMDELMLPTRFLWSEELRLARWAMRAPSRVRVRGRAWTGELLAATGEEECNPDGSVKESLKTMPLRLPAPPGISRGEPGTGAEFRGTGVASRFKDAALLTRLSASSGVEARGPVAGTALDPKGDVRGAIDVPSMASRIKSVSVVAGGFGCCSV